MKIIFIVMTVLFFAINAQSQIISHPKAKDVIKRTQRSRPMQALQQPGKEQVFERSARDLIYMPTAGDYILASSLNYTLQAASYHANAVHIADLSQTGYKLNMSILGGITEFLAFSLKVAQGESNTELKYTSGSVTTLKNTGFESPTLGASFLVYEQSPFKPVDLIMSFAYTPRFGSSQKATSTKEGNNIATSDKISASLDVVRKFEQYQLGGHLSFQPTASGISEEASTGDEVDVSSPSVIELGGRGQWLLIEQLFLTGGLSYVMYGASESSNQTTRSSSDPYSLIGFQVGMKYMLNPQNTYLTGDIGYAMVPDHDAVSAGTRIKITNYSATVFGFGIAHTF